MIRKAKKIACAGLTAVLLMTASIPANADTVTDFTDVSPGAWYYPAVTYAVENGLFAGTSSDTFSPNMGMTQGMFVTVLGRKSGVDKSEYSAGRFSDVKSDDWFGPYVEWAAENCIVSGTGGNKFSPDQKINREQMAAILYRYADITNANTSKDLVALEKFPDSGKVSSYAREAMAWAVTHGVLKGTNGRLDPQGTATRAHVTQVFKNAEQVLGEKESDKIPRITLTPEQQAALTSEQDPQEVVRLVIAGTKARWDNTLNAENAYEIRLMSFGDVLADEFTPAAEAMGSTKHTVFNTLEYLNDTGADRFYIAPLVWEGKPTMKLHLYYTIPTKQDSPIMAEARKIIETKYPNAVFTPDAIKTGAGWRGYNRVDEEKTVAENTAYIAACELHYLDEWYTPEQTFNYWISEPEPGKFYFFY